MQEAMHRSTQELSEAEFQRKEIPIKITPHKGVGDFPLSPLVTLQRILFTEEQAAFQNALSQSSSASKIHPLASLHHGATYQASLCKLIEYCLAPVVSSLWDHHEQNKVKLSVLREEGRQLAETERVVQQLPRVLQPMPGWPTTASDWPEISGVGRK